MKKEEILDKIKQLQPSYLSDWNITDDDPAWAVSEIFADMLSELYKEYEHFPNKLLIEYFDKLNFTQKAPLAATVPVVFKLTENVKSGVAVPKYTKLSTENKTVFETTQTHMITSSNLLYFYDVRNSKFVTNHTSKVGTKEEMVLFSSSKNEHYVYFGDDNLFNIHKEAQAGIGLEYIVPKVIGGKWEYFGKASKDGEAKWNSFLHFNNSTKLNKAHPYKTEKTIINGIETFWIRVKISGELPKSYVMNFSSSSDIDGLFHNSTPLKRTGFLYPFGHFSQVNDLFYISSSEAFSKSGFTIDIDFYDINYHPLALNDSIFSWEYWNSKAWKPLASNNFVVPDDIAKTNVNGEENYWIRIRLLDNSGYIKYSCDGNNKLNPEPTPLKLRKIKINVLSKNGGKVPNHILQYKNLEYENYPFENEVVENGSIVYLGFSKPFEFGLISLYTLINNEVQGSKNVLKWQIYNGKWETLNVKDETNSFTKSGFIQFISESNQKTKTIFGKTSYWIRAVFEENSFSTRKINGIYLNAINARQSETIKNILLGSSDGSGFQEFTLNDPNVFNLKLWVLEDSKPLEYESYEDKFGDGYWVLWSSINHLQNAKGEDRVYEENSSLSKITFGDDRTGKIPPMGKDNIIVTYSIGGGVLGNVKEKEVNTLVDTVAYIDSVENPIAAMGGANIQSIESLIEVAPKRFKHKYKAVTDEDFYYLVKEASSNIAKVSVISSRGLVQLAFIPFGSQKIPMPTFGLKNLIYNYIEKKASAVTRLEVVDPQPIALDVQVQIMLTSWEYATDIKNSIEDKLNEFLHPITGSITKKGWEFGQLPLLSEVYMLINQIEGIYKVPSIKILLSSGKSYSIDSQNMPTLSRQNIIYSGTHTVDIIYDEGSA